MQARQESAPQIKMLFVCSSIFAAGAVAVLLLPKTISGIFSSAFLPHAYCYLYDKSLMALHVSSDTIIWISYVAISITLGYIVSRTRSEIPFSWMFLAFGVFIIACGFTHFMEVVVLWYPLYWLAGDIKLVTAVASIVTAITLPMLVPKIRAMIVSAHVSEHRKNMLQQANDSLQTEITSRTRAEADLRQLSAQLLGSQDEERRRLARELHDSTGQVLAALNLNLELLQREQRGLEPESERRLAHSISLAGQAIKEVRTTSYLLHPPMLDEAGLGLAIEWYTSGFTERSGVQVDLSIPSNLPRLSRDVETALFRIVQEGLTNIHRHANSRAAHIELTADLDRVLLKITDWGTGMKPAPQSSNGDKTKFGVGLRGMRERVLQLGGSLDIVAGNPGTIISVALPVTFVAA